MLNKEYKTLYPSIVPKNSIGKHVISLNGQPICISKSGKRASDIIAYLQGYDIVINDGKLQKQLNKIKAKMHKR